MNKTFEVEIKFNQNNASDMHFQEFLKEIKASLYLNVSKGVATARTMNVKEKKIRRKKI